MRFQSYDRSFKDYFSLAKDSWEGRNSTGRSIAFFTLASRYSQQEKWSSEDLTRGEMIITFSRIFLTRFFCISVSFRSP